MIREIKWTTHARRRLSRLRKHGVGEAEIEAVIRSEHDYRETNSGKADWRVTLTDDDGRRFAVVYDHPDGNNRSRARVVTVFHKGTFRRR